MGRNTIILLVCLFLSASAQDQDAYTNSSSQKSIGLLDPSRLSVQHSLSFGMASMSGVSSLKSQSLYTTMLQYRFTAPVTVNLNFSLPIHSTFSSSQNLTPDNISSLDYFKSVPFNFSLNWQPIQNLQLLINVSHMTENDYYWGNNYNGFDRFQRYRLIDRSAF